VSALYRKSLLILAFGIAMSGASAAYGQGWDCANVCDPYNSSCDQYCEVCWMWDQDGCIAWNSSDCGSSSAGCIPSNCTPSWSETSRITQGTYDGRSFSHCNHHVVDKVTMTDGNNCNTNSAYRSYWYCDDWVDDYKNNCCYPSCCEGTGENNTQLECNGVHYCS
jgi:hypothetical protein